MTYGRRAGAGVRAGGWGELFGDEGSATGSASRRCAHSSKMSDGRAERGLCTTC